jgi:LacI family transcriptional regulator
VASIWDVAKLAGVSKSTVSRVISNNGSVKEETRLAIERAMRELSYSPSYFAQGIRTGKTKTIAMLVPDNQNVFYNAMLDGIEDVAMKYGYMVLICNTHRDLNTEISYAKELLKRNIDGIIYNTYEKSRKNLDYFLNLSETLPVVFMDNIVPPGEKAPFVISEGYRSSKEAVEYLYRQGCRRIAYLRIPPDVSVINHRYEGYKAGLQECGMTIDKELVFQSENRNNTLTHMDVGMEGAKFLMNLPNKPDAIMAPTDVIAIGAIKYLKGQGIRIPQDVKIVGYDNIALCTLVDPMLTTIAQPIKEIGAQAARILINKINGVVNEKEQLVLDTKLIVREST